MRYAVWYRKEKTIVIADGFRVVDGALRFFRKEGTNGSSQPLRKKLVALFTLSSWDSVREETGSDHEQ